MYPREVFENEFPGQTGKSMKNTREGVFYFCLKNISSTRNISTAIPNVYAPTITSDKDKLI